MYRSWHQATWNFTWTVSQPKYIIPCQPTDCTCSYRLLIVSVVVALRSLPVCVCISSDARILFFFAHFCCLFLFVSFFFVYFFFFRSEYISQPHFQCVRLSCDHGWIPGGSVEVRQSINQPINHVPYADNNSRVCRIWRARDVARKSSFCPFP